MRFYTLVFEVRFGEVVMVHGNRMAHFPFQEGSDGASGALAQGEVYVPTKNGAIVYFSVAEIEPVLERAVNHGGKVLFPKTPVDVVQFVAEIEDSEGNRIAILSS